MAGLPVAHDWPLKGMQPEQRQDIPGFGGTKIGHASQWTLPNGIQGLTFADASKNYRVVANDPPFPLSQKGCSPVIWPTCSSLSTAKETKLLADVFLHFCSLIGPVATSFLQCLASASSFLQCHLLCNEHLHVTVMSKPCLTILTIR